MPQRWYIGKFVPLHWILFEIHTFLKVNKISLTPSINSSFIFQEIQKNFICFLHASFRLEISHNNSYKSKSKYLVTDFSHHLLWRPESLRVIRNWFLEFFFLLIYWNFFLLTSWNFFYRFIEFFSYNYFYPPL